MMDIHFDDGEWADFVRDVASPELAQRMQAHLNRECEVCAKSLAIWNLVSQVASREQSYEAPESAIRVVKSAFGWRQKLSFLARQAQMARMVFDSFQDPVPAGLRGSGTGARHLLHEAGDFHVDIWLDQENEGRVWLAGQLRHREGETAHTGGASVVFVRGDDDIVAQTIANEVGEFQQELDARGKLRIFLHIPNIALIGIELSPC
jgi:hypothetical protein